MKHVLALLLTLGLFASLPVTAPAQDPKPADEKKMEEKPAEAKPTAATPAPAPAPAGEMSFGDKVYHSINPILPFILLVLILVLFMMVASLRTSLNQLEERVKGGGE